MKYFIIHSPPAANKQQTLKTNNFILNFFYFFLTSFHDELSSQTEYEYNSLSEMIIENSYFAFYFSIQFFFFVFASAFILEILLLYTIFLLYTERALPFDSYFTLIDVPKTVNKYYVLKGSPSLRSFCYWKTGLEILLKFKNRKSAGNKCIHKQYCIAGVLLHFFCCCIYSQNLTTKFSQSTKKAI